MKHLLRLVRPSQWTKNVFVFGPVVFGGALFRGEALCQAALAFVAFSLAASSIYCFNDINDVADDMRHPEKRHRPIASGAVTIAQAYGLMAGLFVLSMLVCVWQALLSSHAAGESPSSVVDSPAFGMGGVILFYWLLNLAYTARLKQYAIIDVCIVATGFVLRLLAGGMATGITLSKWIVLMTFLLTLFMGFAKRRDDVLRMEKTGEAPRRNTSSYNMTFINQAITITAAVTLVCYIMYTVSPEVVSQFHTDYLYLTSVFVLLGLLRYIQIAVVQGKSGNPTKVMIHDRFIQLDVLAWLLTFIFIIYVW
ncbi:MAG: decaprenyl-phosphate phosphoribosyltransferase [Prevotella sp.]|nr:decaprenyl-phosphate phosphoribosyltransferase [Prevotella sp.]